MPSTSSAYPVALKTFTTKRNLLDDVDASHINDIQTEISGIEQTLGLMPTYDAASKINFNDVAQRLNFLQAGEASPAFYIGRGGGSTFSSQNGSTHQASTTLTTGDLHIMSLPDIGVDDYGMFDGVGAKIPTAGWWWFGAQVSFQAGGSTGSRTVSIGLWRGNNQNVFAGGTQTIPVENNSIVGKQAMHLNTSTMYPMQAGDHVDLRVAVNSLGLVPNFNYTVFNAALFGFRFRNLKAPTGTWPTPGK